MHGFFLVLFEKNIEIRCLKSFFTGLFFSVFILSFSHSLCAEWTSPVDISVSGTNVFPMVGVDAKGNSVAAWTNTTTDRIQASTLAFGATSWSVPEEISTPGKVSDQPFLAVAENGNAVAVWNNISDTSIEGATLAFGATSWSTALTISDVADIGVNRPVVGVDPNGNAVAAWESFTGAAFLTRAATLVFGAPAWTAPANIPFFSPIGIGPISLGVDAVGNAVVVFQVSGGSEMIIASSLVSGIWSFPAIISGILTFKINPSVGVDAAGNAVAIWNDTSLLDIQASTLPFGGVWSVQMPISDNIAISSSDSSYNVSVASKSGDAVAVWKNKVTGSFQATTLAFGSSSWSTPVDISPTGLSVVSSSQVSVGANGFAAAVWYNSITGVIQVATLAPGDSSWSSPVDISDPGIPPAVTDFTSIQVGVSVDPNGNIVAVWENGGIIQGAFFKSFGPPENLIGVAVNNRFLTQTDRIHKITWSTGGQNIVSYRVYVKGKVVSTVASNKPLEAVFHNQKKGVPVTYSVRAVDASGGESDAVSITLN